MRHPGLPYHYRHGDTNLCAAGKRAWVQLVAGGELPLFEVNRALENPALHLGVPVQTSPAVAPKAGACGIIGKTLFFTDPDVLLLLKVIGPSPLHSTTAAKPGTTGAPSPKAGYQEALKRLTTKPQNGSRRKPKQPLGVVTSMDRVRTRHSRKPRSPKWTLKNRRSFC
jgi:hypothetical protein